MVDPATPAPVSAQVVGNAFVQQYYHILHQSSEILCRFYQDISTLGRPEEDGSMSTTTTMMGINDKILSLNYGDFKSEIRTVDALESINGGLIVLVTGNLTGKDNILRKFAQSFFLAPQEKGYFVLNDVFRYIENANHHGEDHGFSLAPAIPEQAPEIVPVPENNTISKCMTDLHVGFDRRNYFDVLADCGPQPPSGTKNTSELTQQVLESLFKAPKSSKHEQGSINWKDLVKKMESLDRSLDFSYEDTVKKQHIPAKGDDYQDYRTTASQHWDSMKSYYQKAATAEADRKHEYAAHLYDQGRICKEKARQADERAGQDIFNSRNKNIENVITIDLHGQHVKQGMKLLKRHLLLCAYVRSVRLFRVITGHGSHSNGKSKIKQSVVNLLKAENIEWNEENKGVLLIKLNGRSEFSFLNCGTTSDSD